MVVLVLFFVVWGLVSWFCVVICELCVFDYFWIACRVCMCILGKLVVCYVAGGLLWGMV